MTSVDEHIAGRQPVTLAVEQRLKQLIAEARTSTPEAQIRLGLALVRLTLQYAALPLAEWVIEHCEPSRRPRVLGELRAPSDGTLIQALADSIQAAESEGWTGVRGGYWTPATTTAGQHFLKRNRATPAEMLAACVASRNDSLEGHGLPGGDDGAAYLALAEFLIDSGPKCFPRWDGSALAIASPDGRRTEVTLLRVGADNNLVCYRKSKHVGIGRCRVDAQQQIDLFNKKDVSWEVQDRLAFELPAESLGGFDFVTTQQKGWHPLVCLPERLTPVFTGRQREIAQLLEWFDDEGARACLVWGDGGMGKTTLVVEFLHRVLTDSPAASWRPKIVSYYSAKQTRWGTSGLERIQHSQIGLPDALIDIARRLEGGAKLDKAWFEKAGAGGSLLARYFGSYLLDTWKIKPSEHLIVLDNTETLATSDEDIQLLGQQITHVARYCGRVLLTSRRAEQLGATPIPVERLTADEAVGLLSRRAASLKVRELLEAKPVQLRQFVDELEYTPLLLEAFAKTMTEQALSANRALSRVRLMKQKDLGEFLYADAWARFPVAVQHFLLLLVRLGDVHDETMLRLAAEAAGVGIVAATAALEESRGIAKVTRIRGDVQVTFRKGFQDFCANRQVTIGSLRVPEASAVSRIKSRYEKYLATKDGEIADRLASAFRKPFAKMARSAFLQGRMDECQEYYELAISEDPSNALLFDRYAYFLLKQQRVEEALGKANRASELAPTEAEVWFTRGIILGHLGKATEAVASLDRASQLGKPVHLVKVQMAYALLRAPEPLEALAREAVRDARDASPRVPDQSSAGFFEKHWGELRALERRLGMPSSASL